MTKPSLTRSLPALPALLALVALLAGCATPQPPQRPPEPAPPPAWQGAASDAAAAVVSSADAPWWRALGDAQLDALQAQALQANIETQRKAIAWQSANLRVRLATLDEQPAATLSLGANANHPLQTAGDSTVVVNGVSVPVSRQTGVSRSYGAGAGLSYEWDLWQRLAQASRAEAADAESRREDLRAARWLVSAKVAEAYWTIAALDAKLPLLAELAEAADETHRIGLLRLAEGKLRPDEVNLLVTKQHEARRRVAGAQADRRLQAQALALLLDGTPALADAARLPGGEPPEPALGSPAHTLERRPDVRQARLAVDAALARLHVAEASRYPSLRMSLGVQTSGSTWRDWLSQPLATLGLNVAVPLVDWRRLDGQRDIARNMLDDAALALRASVRQAVADVDNALVERDRWLQEQDALQARQAERNDIYAIALRRQQAGVYGRLNVLQSRQEVLAAQAEAIELRLKAWLNQLNLYKALGGAV